MPLLRVPRCPFCQSAPYIARSSMITLNYKLYCNNIECAIYAIRISLKLWIKRIPLKSTELEYVTVRDPRTGQEYEINV